MILTYPKHFFYPLDFNQNNSNSLSNITWTLTDIFMTRCLQNTAAIPVVSSFFQSHGFFHKQNINYFVKALKYKYINNFK